MTDTRYPLLSGIDHPADLRALDANQIPAVAKELRAYLLDAISSCGGTLWRGLGCH